jgi:hypothetical protein
MNLAKLTHEERENLVIEKVERLLKNLTIEESISVCTEMRSIEHLEWENRNMWNMAIIELKSRSN